MQKRIHNLKVGDVVLAHGAKFLITQNATESQAHRPRFWSNGNFHNEHGASDTAYALSVCIEGYIEGYFEPSGEWTFQGNFKAPLLTVEG
jgi:hypothetical protein